jgi:hypothetical protein
MLGIITDIKWFFMELRGVMCKGYMAFTLPYMQGFSALLCIKR